MLSSYILLFFSLNAFSSVLAADVRDSDFSFPDPSRPPPAQRMRLITDRYPPWFLRERHGEGVNVGCISFNYTPCVEFQARLLGSKKNSSDVAADNGVVGTLFWSKNMSPDCGIVEVVVNRYLKDGFRRG